MLTTKQTLLRAVGLAGTVTFAVFFTFTFSVPDWVESFAADFIESEVTGEIDRTIEHASLYMMPGAHATVLQARATAVAEQLGGVPAGASGLAGPAAACALAPPASAQMFAAAAGSTPAMSAVPIPLPVLIRALVDFR